MEFITDYRIEDYIMNTTWEDFPYDVKERALCCSLDLMCALILGSQGQQYKTGLRVAKRIGAVGDIPVFCEKQTLNLLGAAISFSHAANSYDIDDGYNMVKGHPGSSFIGALLASALERNCSYNEYLTTLVVCYETAIRMGLVEQKHYGFLHSTGTYGAFGSAVAVGRIHKLKREELNSALSIADYHAPLTPVMRAVEYPSMNKDGVPFGTLTGVMAVIETEEGEYGKTHLLEMSEYNEYVDSIGQKYYIRDLYFKPYTCCRWAHQPIKASIDLMQEYEIQQDQIQKVMIHTFEAATRLSKAVPTTTDEAQYNIAFPVAAAIVYGDVGYNQIRDEALCDEIVISMMNRIAFVVDPDLEKRFPDERLSWIEIYLKDGRSIRSKVYAAPGEHTDPALSPEWFWDKFKRITTPIISDEGSDAIRTLLMRNSDIPIREMFKLVNRYLPI